MSAKTLVVTTCILLVGAGLTIAVLLANHEALFSGAPSPKPAESDARSPTSPPPSAPPGEPAVETTDKTPPSAPTLPAPDAGPPPHPAPAPATALPSKPEGLSVDEATLCKSVDRDDRKPLHTADTFRVQDGPVWCFVKLSGGSGRKVRVLWQLGGKTYPGIWLQAGAEGAETWRTWAYKNIDDTMVGEGRVEIVDEKDAVLRSLPVHIQAP